MKIKGVVFDLDHTLFDRYATLYSYAPEAYKAIKEWLAEGVTEEQFTEAFIYADRRLAPYGWYTMFGYLMDKKVLRRDISYDGALRIVHEHFQSTYAVPFSFQKELMDELHAMGLKTGLITNGIAECQRKKVDLLGLTPLLDEIILAGDFPVQKPDPFLFEEMARRMQAEPGELLYVGDHPINDYLGSKKVGYTPVLVKPSGFITMPEAFDAEYVVDSVAELPELIRRNQWI